MKTELYSDKVIQNLQNLDKSKLNTEKAIHTLTIYLCSITNTAYRYIFTKEWFEAYIFGSKNSAKSWTIIAILSIIEILVYKKNNVMIFRENISLNRKSTLPLVIKVMGEVWDKLVMPLENFNSFRDEFHRQNSPQPMLTHKVTKQQIHFSGRDNPENSQSITPEIGHFSLTIDEETISPESRYQVINEDAFLQNREVIKESLQRGDITDPKFKPKYIAIGNLFSSTHPDAKIVDKYVPFNKQWMEKYGSQMYYDPNYFYNKKSNSYRGILIMRTNAQVNNFRSSESIMRAERMKEKSPELYNVIYLGATGESTTSAFKGVIKMASEILPFEDTRKMILWGIGVDVGASKSATAFTPILTPNIPNETYMKHYIGFDTYRHRNNDSEQQANQKTEKAYANDFYSYAKIWVLKYNALSDKDIFVAFDKEGWRHLFQETFWNNFRYESINDRELLYPSLKNFKFILNDKKNTKENLKIERVALERYMMLNDIIKINPDPKCHFQQELPKISIKEKENVDGVERIDGNDDMIESYENWYLLHKETILNKWQEKNKEEIKVGY